MSAASTKVGVLAGGCVAVAVASGVSSGWGEPRAWALPALAMLVAASELAVVRLAFGRQRWAMSLTEAVIAGALVLAPGAWTAAAVALGVLGAQLLRRRPPLKSAFNVAQFAVSTALAAWTAGVVGHPLGGAVAGMVVFAVANYLLVATAVALTSSRSLGRLLMGAEMLVAVHTIGNSSVGLLGAWLAVHAPLGLLGLVAPVALMWHAYQQETHRAAEARVFAELARGQEQAAGRSLDLSAQALVTTVGRLLGAEVQLLVVGAEGIGRYTGDAAVARRSRAGAAAFDEPWVMRALAGAGPCIGVDSGRPWCSVVIGGSQRPAAVLEARRPVGAPAFERAETEMVTLLAAQARSWLAIADLTGERDLARAQAETAESATRALGDLGADTGPALLVLRESAGRLARLTREPGSAQAVQDIVDELHAVERAVASLLGALALAAEPGVTVAGELPRRPVDEWTTTGVLAGDQRG